MELTRINNDVNGKPRYVVAYSELLNESDEKEARRLANQPGPIRFFVDFEYQMALKKAKQIGGRKFHNKQYGGGIVFQSYNTDQLLKDIAALKNS
jgi:hypothetical protein